MKMSDSQYKPENGNIVKQTFTTLFDMPLRLGEKDLWPWNILCRSSHSDVRRTRVETRSFCDTACAAWRPDLPICHRTAIQAASDCTTKNEQTEQTLALHQIVQIRILGTSQHRSHLFSAFLESLGVKAAGR
jgi:hypothetical protein